MHVTYRFVGVRLDDGTSRTVHETAILEHHVGVQWTFQQLVTVHEPGGGAPVAGRIAEIKRCRGKQLSSGVGGGAAALREKPIDCFVLLLSRDGSHGLDLSMVTHLFLCDKVVDPAVEQQVEHLQVLLGHFHVPGRQPQH